MPRREVVERLNKFVTVQLYTDFVPIETLTQPQRKALAEKNQELILDVTDEPSNPYYAVMTPDGRLVKAIGGYRPPSVFVKFLDEALAESQKDGRKVAQAATAG
jgi:thiol:disulfide interchange protein DsbD